MYKTHLGINHDCPSLSSSNPIIVTFRLGANFDDEKHSTRAYNRVRTTLLKEGQSESPVLTTRTWPGPWPHVNSPATMDSFRQTA